MSTDEMEEIARRGPLAIVKYHGEFWVTGPEIMVIVEDEKEGRQRNWEQYISFRDPAWTLTIFTLAKSGPSR
jgi:hypothetical protein